MLVKENLSNNNPQIHLLAAKYCEKIREIDIQSVNAKQLKTLLSCIQFFEHYIKYLPKCVNDVLKICRCFLTLTKNGLIPFDISAINRILGICISMLVLQKEEDAIRSTCFVFKELLDIIPPSNLKDFFNKYARTLKLIFQKLYVVQTYYTQLRILEILVYINRDLKKLLIDAISEHPLMRNDKEKAKIIAEMISKIDLKNLEISSCEFLKYYNNSLFPKTCILSVKGRLIRMNGHPIKQMENMLVNFNGQNQTISFFIPNSVFSSQKSPEKDFMVFVEFKCESIHSVSKEYKGRPYVDVSIEVSQAVTYNKYMNRESLDEVKTIFLRLIDEKETLKTFSESFYEKFQQNKRMLNDQVSEVDQFTNMSFQTFKYWINNLKTLNEAKTKFKQEINTQDFVKENHISKIASLKSVQIRHNQKRKHPENPLIVNGDIEMEEPPVKIVNQSNKKYKSSNDSITSGRSPTSVFYKEKPAIKRPKPVDNQDEDVTGEKRYRLTIENVFELVKLEKESPKSIEVTSNSISFNMSADHIENQIKIYTQNRDADNESEMSYGKFANDDHQHYSSSSHESLDLDVKNIMKMNNQSIVKIQKKCIEEIQKTKAQLNYVRELLFQYESATSKLMDDVIKQEIIIQALKRELDELTESLNQNFWRDSVVNIQPTLL